MMKLRFWCVTALFFLALFSSFAQEVLVTGVVKDEHKEPIPGVSVWVKGSKKGSSTDWNGAFSLKVQVGQTLVFSAVGASSEERKIVANQPPLQITLKTKVEEIEGTVVVGYGSAKKISTLTGSVDKVEAKDFAKSPSPVVFDALQGKVAGLQISASTGDPGSLSGGSEIKLHGDSTFMTWQSDAGRNNPLFVLDGTQVTAEVITAISPADIESITVLKDASATSIYGAKAANGVIYVTTKKGKRNDQISVNVGTYYGISDLYSRKFYRNLLNSQEYMNLMVERGFVTPSLAKNYLEQYPNDTRWDEYYFRRNTPTFNTNVSILGGSNSASYYISGSYFNQEGAMFNSAFERYNLNSNIDFYLNSWAEAGLNISLGSSKSTPGFSGGSSNGYPILNVPLYGFNDENGNELERIQTPTGIIENPRYLSVKNPIESISKTVVPIGYLKITPIEGLNFKTQLGGTFQSSDYEQKELPSAGISPRTTKENSKFVVRNIVNTLEYDFKVKNHSFTLLAGHEEVETTMESFSGSSSGQINDNLTLLRHGTRDISVNDNKTVIVERSLFGRLNYNWDNRYFVDASVRRDGSSNFGENNRFANFWSAGFMWNVKGEKFLQNVKSIDALNVRFSTGISGLSSIAPYSAVTKITAGADNRYNDAVGYALDLWGNPDLQWEKQRKTTLGVSATLFNRVQVSVDVYDRLTKDMLGEVTLPLTSGFLVRPKNIGELQNRGIDVSLRVTAYENKEKDIYVRPYLNFNYNDQKIISLSNDLEKNGATNVLTGNVILKTGAPITYGLPIFKRVNPQTGDPEWYSKGDDVRNTRTDENAITNEYDLTTLSQNTGVKRTAPTNGGFGVNAGYKGISLQASFAFSYGNYLLNNDRLITDNIISPLGINVAKEARNYWKNPGDNTIYPSVNHRALQRDTRILEDASFIRLKNITLGYTLPEKVIQQIGFFKGINFYVTGRNLLTFTKYTGLDPEFASYATSGANPTTKQYVFGVDLKF